MEAHCPQADNWQTWDSKDQVDKSGKQLGKS